MRHTLAEEIDAVAKFGKLSVDIPNDIIGNLASQIKLRPYQRTALKRWLFYIDQYEARPKAPHLLFHMATGSGKTVLMAGLIIDLYRRGYRNFLFFVNSAQIIEKTKENFLNPASPKHLFAPNVRIDDKPVEVRSVETFDATFDDAINIHFTTIQGLHSKMQSPKENAVTIEDFRDFKVVMISDEAHHLNAMTKGTLVEDEPSWEGTVLEIFSQHPESMLLEFTATVDMNNKAIRAKYADKNIYDYSLGQFREDGYSKDIELRQADLPPSERMMEAMVLSQYRRKVAEAHGIHCKPVILMKSKTIKDSAENEAIFSAMVEQLNGASIEELRLFAIDREDCTLIKAFDYVLGERELSVNDFAQELRGDFSFEKVVNVNNPKDLEARQIELNALEDLNNEIRVIFAVNKLDEGWDVLNLFDIVRLYNTRDGRKNKVGKTTMAEAQLIGRGARYFPFNDPEDEEAEREKRKYDKSLGHPLRILEELHYHCAHNPKYIEDIKKALRETGMIDERTKSVHLRLKESFKATEIFDKAWVYLNRRVPSQRDDVFGLESYKIEKIFVFPTLMTGQVVQTSAFGESQNAVSKPEPVSRTFSVASFGHPVLRFAADGLPFFHLANLKTYFPNLSGMRQFFDDPDYLGEVEVLVRGPAGSLDNMLPKQKVEVCRYVLRQIEAATKREAVEFEGSREFIPRQLKDLFVDKTIKLRKEGETGRSWSDSYVKDLDKIDLSQKEWHAYQNSYGTDQEKLFIQYLNDQYDRLMSIYDDFYLLRNEKAFKLYAFADGRALEPDFLLMLRKRTDNSTSIIQIFVEPKGEHLEQSDAWKQKFLQELNGKAQLSIIAQNANYRIFGAPFFNDKPGKKSRFDKDFQKIVGVLELEEDST